MSDKVFTEENNPKHKLIMALKKKGYTKVVVKWHGAMSYSYTKGWTMESEQTGWKQLGYEVKKALSTIETLDTVTKKQSI
jgi:ABC-type branched-subunit amino acid transport system substrate-binding protein